MEKPLSEWSGKELQAEIDLYIAAGADVPKVKNKGEAIAFIEKARAEGGIGIPHEVTEADLADENNKDLIEQGVKVGDIILLGPIGPKPDNVNDDGSPKDVNGGAPKEPTEEEIKAKEEADKDDPKKKNGSVDKSKSQQRREEVQKEADKGPQLYFQRKPVIGVNNKLVNGKLYKEVVLNGETMLLTTEEFEKQVKPL
jgi:hypothetical protein